MGIQVIRWLHKQNAVLLARVESSCLGSASSWFLVSEFTLGFAYHLFHFVLFCWDLDSRASPV